MYMSYKGNSIILIDPYHIIKNILLSIKIQFLTNKFYNPFWCKSNIIFANLIDYCYVHLLCRQPQIIKLIILEYSVH